MSIVVLKITPAINAGYPLGASGNVHRIYEYDELHIHEKKDFVWCTSVIIDMQQKMTK